MILEMAHDWYEKTRKTSPWDTALFKDVYNMTNDARGAFGEHIFSKAIHSLKWNIQVDTSNSNIHEDGHYDIKANNQRIEIKTSCLSTNGWQHEPLYKNDECDWAVFIDFYYDFFYITIIKNNDLPLGKDSEFFKGKHATLRKNKSDGYKLDFSQKNINNLIKKNKCKKFNPDATIDEISIWIQEGFN